MKMKFRSLIFLILLVPVVLSAAPGDEVYLLGVSDVLQLNVVQSPNMDRQLTVRQDGTVVLPSVGAIAVAGFSVVEAEQILKDKLVLYDRSIQDVTLSIVQFNSLQIYILGAVRQPGSYTFSSKPTLWDLIRESGGVTPEAVLTDVKIISNVDGVNESSDMDITDLVSGNNSVTPTFLNTGDTVVIPTSSQLFLTSSVSGVQVFGGVSAPGTYRIKDPMRLVDILMLAGAPTDDAQLEKVIWVHNVRGDLFTSSTINCKLFMLEGDLVGNPLVYPGDVVQVTLNRGGFWRTVYPLILGTLTTVATVAFAAHRLGL
ncbi:MAG: hypothetical protein GY752_07310 [bacterium]|nr:hypothetical protein [bacterium]MCP4799864.1 hypothetical protein [bacterium]